MASGFNLTLDLADSKVCGICSCIWADGVLV